MRCAYNDINILKTGFLPSRIFFAHLPGNYLLTDGEKYLTALKDDQTFRHLDFPYCATPLGEVAHYSMASQDQQTTDVVRPPRYIEARMLILLCYRS